MYLGRIAPRECGRVSLRRCERSEAIHFRRAKEEWIASSHSLSSGARSRDPLARAMTQGRFH